MDNVFVMAIDKHSGFVKTSTSCSKTDAPRYARYYSSIGYSIRTLDETSLEDFLNEQRRQYRANCRIERETLAVFPNG